jgi:hypothetical protein
LIPESATLNEGSKSEPKITFEKSLLATPPYCVGTSQAWLLEHTL